MLENGTLAVLNVKDILPNRFQPRILFDDSKINELADSIRKYGVIEPIVVRQIGNKYEIIAGERRYKASILANRTSIPAIVISLSDYESKEIALLENIQRQGLSPIEEAVSYRRILDSGYITLEELSHKVGKKQKYVMGKIKLLDLDDEVQDALLHNKISERHARSLLRIDSKVHQRQMLKAIIKNRFTVKKTDDFIDRYLRTGIIPGDENERVKKIFNVSEAETLDLNKDDKINDGLDSSNNERKNEGDKVDLDKILNEAQDINVGNENKPQADMSMLMQQGAVSQPASLNGSDVMQANSVGTGNMNSGVSSKEVVSQPANKFVNPGVLSGANVPLGDGSGSKQDFANRIMTNVNGQNGNIVGDQSMVEDSNGLMNSPEMPSGTNMGMSNEPMSSPEVAPAMNMGMSNEPMNSPEVAPAMNMGMSNEPMNSPEVAPAMNMGMSNGPMNSPEVVPAMNMGMSNGPMNSPEVAPAMNMGMSNGPMNSPEMPSGTNMGMSNEPMNSPEVAPAMNMGMSNEPMSSPEVAPAMNMGMSNEPMNSPEVAPAMNVGMSNELMSSPEIDGTDEGIDSFNQEVMDDDIAVDDDTDIGVSEDDLIDTGDDNDIEDDEQDSINSDDDIIDEDVDEANMVDEQVVETAPVSEADAHKLMQAINLIRNCAKEVEKLGFTVDSDEMSLDDDYQVILTIHRQ